MSEPLGGFGTRFGIIETVPCHARAHGQPRELHVFTSYLVCGFVMVEKSVRAK